MLGSRFFVHRRPESLTDAADPDAYQGDSFATFIGDYLESVLLPFYDVHHALVVAKTAVEKSAARGWMDVGGLRTGTG